MYCFHNCDLDATFSTNSSFSKYNENPWDLKSDPPLEKMTQVFCPPRSCSIFAQKIMDTPLVQSSGSLVHLPLEAKTKQGKLPKNNGVVLLPKTMLLPVVGGGGGGVLQISSDGDDRRIFSGLKFSITGTENLASIFLGSLI